MTLDLEAAGTLQVNLNVQQAIASMAGNINLYKRVLLKFREGYVETADTIAAHLQEGNMEDAERIAHTLKGLAGNVGAAELAEASRVLEAALHNGADTAECEQALAVFRIVLSKSIEAIDTTLATL